MTERELIRLLRGAVLKALPAAAALTMGCSGGLCIQTPKETKSDAKVTLTMKLEPGEAHATLDECIKRCEQLIQQQELQYGAKIADFRASRCEVLKDPRDIPVIDCDAQFERITSYVEFSGIGCPVPGRMPAGLVVHQQQASSELGHYFAEMASMEAAAVTAFEYLARELTAHGAPMAFVERAQQAADEEVEHAQMAGLLAAAYQARPWSLSAEPFAVRPLEELALENAAEGCVRETFASVCALWQSLHAQEPAVRLVLERIAVEESEHAALSWQLHRWLMPQLTPDQRAACQEAQERAIDALEASFLEGASPSLRDAVGLPSPEDSRRIFHHLRDTLWT